jgi:hypothetical protein
VNRPPFLWTFKGCFLLKTNSFSSGVLGGVNNSKNVNNFEINQQGELAALLVFIGLFCVLDPAVNFDALGPSRIIYKPHQRFLTRASFCLTFNISKV